MINCPHCKKEITKVEELSLFKELLKESNELKELKAMQAAENYGATSFYDNKKKEDNPYTGTYVRPEVIVEGVNDEMMTDHDRFRHELERAWFKGWIEENIKNERFIKEKQNLEKMKEMIRKLEDMNKRVDDVLPPPEAKKGWLKKLFGM
jgi:hypothetical protein